MYKLVHYLRDKHTDLEFEVFTSRNVYRSDQILPPREVSERLTIDRISTPKSNRPSTMLRLGAGMLYTFGALASMLRRPRCDLLLVVTNPPSGAMATRAIHAIRNTPYLYLVHDLYPDVANVAGVLPATSPISKTLKSLQKGWLHASVRTVVLGRCMRDYLVEKYDVPAQQIEVIPNWGDPDEIAPSETSRFREANKIDGVAVLYSGNFGMPQNFDVILDAAKLLQSRDPSIVFLLVGRGHQEQHIRDRIRAESIANVRMFDLVKAEDYSDLLAAADIGLVTLAKGAEGIGVPSKFYSTLASGRPTVAIVAPTSEVALVLTESESGYQVDYDDAPGLARIIGELADDSDLRKRLGQNARKTLMEKYTLEHIGERFYQTIKSIGHGRANDL